jgi:hypothetical protein
MRAYIGIRTDSEDEIFKSIPGLKFGTVDDDVDEAS